MVQCSLQPVTVLIPTCPVPKHDLFLSFPDLLLCLLIDSVLCFESNATSTTMSATNLHLPFYLSTPSCLRPFHRISFVRLCMRRAGNYPANDADRSSFCLEARLCPPLQYAIKPREAASGATLCGEINTRRRACPSAASAGGPSGKQSACAAAEMVPGVRAGSGAWPA